MFALITKHTYVDKSLSSILFYIIISRSLISRSKLYIASHHMPGLYIVQYISLPKSGSSQSLRHKSPEKSNQSGPGLFGPAEPYQMSYQSCDCLHAYLIRSGRRSISDQLCRFFFKMAARERKEKGF